MGIISTEFTYCPLNKICTDCISSQILIVYKQTHRQTDSRQMDERTDTDGRRDGHLVSSNQFLVAHGNQACWDCQALLYYNWSTLYWNFTIWVMDRLCHLSPDNTNLFPLQHWPLHVDLYQESSGNMASDCAVWPIKGAKQSCHSSLS